MLANILVNDEHRIRIVQKTIFTAIGFIASLTFLIIGMQRLGANMISAYRLFAASITQGSFQEAWRLPFEYFWYTEHAVILMLGTLSIIAILSQFKESRQDTKFWAGGILFIYLCLFIPSVILKYFVVYGRLARQLIPFLVLLSAQGMVQVENR